MWVDDGISARKAGHMIDGDIDPPKTNTETDDAAGDDEAVEDAGDLGAADSPPGDENASDDPQGIVGEEA
jgi:hypothetical protein